MLQIDGHEVPVSNPTKVLFPQAGYTKLDVVRYYLAVAADRRGRGMGRALVRAAEAWLRARDAPKVQLMVRGDNAAAAGFYRALGYEPQEVVVMGRRPRRGEGDGRADQQGR